MTNLSYLFAAYAVVWAGIFFYLLAIARKNARLEREIRELEEQLQRADMKR